jgi:catechol 2,3-dioxygenase-like lactoylglutathione lyase family enzyme
MLDSSLVCATLPTRDMERSRRFYTETLGLSESRLGLEGGAYYDAGGGTVLHVYETPAAIPEHTAASFLVKDLGAVISELRERGVELEEYDLPGLKTEDGVATLPEGFRGAWIKDPDGNILGLRDY